MTNLRWWAGLLLAACLLGLSAGAFASGTCTITSVTLGGQTYTGTTINATGTANYTCTRTSNGADGSPTTLNVTAAAGSYPASGTRNAGNGTQRLAYSLASNASAWGDGTAGLGGPQAISVAFGTGGTTTASGSLTFTITIGGGQTPLTGRTYTDTVAIGGTCTMNKGSACTVTGASLAVSVLVPTTCSLTPPTGASGGSFNLAYTSFQPGQAQSSTSFAVNCSNGGPYRMSVNATTGTAAGISYSLKVGTGPNSATDISSTTTYNLTGTGIPITYYVNATAAGGQAGTCASLPCQQTGPLHTLLVEF